jgi:hypothetical protein
MSAEQVLSGAFGALPGLLRAYAGERPNHLALVWAIRR